MEASQKFYDKLIEFEGLKTAAYLDSAGVPTIGIGTIKYPDGRKVRLGDICTNEQALAWAKHDAGRFEMALSLMVPSTVTQQRFDALLLLMYNIGEAGLRGSTVMRLIKKNPADPAIKAAWMSWNKARVKGVLKEVRGLTIRRGKEYALYAAG